MAEFARGKYGVKFPLFEKIDVNGADANPIYALLKLHLPGEVRGNFYKYLVGRDGLPLSVHGKKDSIASFEEEIVDALLARPSSLSLGQEKWSLSALEDAGDSAHALADAVVA